MEFIENYAYREESFPIFYDDNNQEYLTIIDGKTIGFGRLNTDYKSLINYLVDDKLDTILKIEPKGKLSWFTNGCRNHRDIKLEYVGRLVKVWLVDNTKDICLASIAAQAHILIKKLSSKDTEI